MELKCYPAWGDVLFDLIANSQVVILTWLMAGHLRSALGFWLCFGSMGFVIFARARYIYTKTKLLETLMSHYNLFHEALCPPQKCGAPVEHVGQKQGNNGK